MTPVGCVDLWPLTGIREQEGGRDCRKIPDLSFGFVALPLPSHGPVKVLTLLWSPSQDLGVWVCANPCAVWGREEDAPMGKYAYGPWENIHPKPWLCWPRMPSGCRARLSAPCEPQPWACTWVAHGLLSSLGSVLTEITLRPGGVSWGREEYNFLIVQSISFPAVGLNLFLSEVLSVCINHLSLYVFVAVATVWLIEFQSVFLYFKAMIKSHST